MSSGQIFPTLPGNIESIPICADNSTGLVSSEWYPATAAYQFPDASYITPFPSSTFETQPCFPARISVPDLHYSGDQQYLHHSQHVTPLLESQQLPTQARNAERPRSSPSTFGPSPESIAWTSAGLGISNYHTTTGQPTPVTSTFPPASYTGYSTDDNYGNVSPPIELRQPTPRRAYPALAPNPDGLKRKRDDEERYEPSMAHIKIKKPRKSSLVSNELSEDDRYLVHLKEEENLPWKDIANKFHTEKGKTHQVAALQMRYKRLREKFRVWEDQDVLALQRAHEYWETHKWEIISSKMLEYQNVQEKWPARHCQKKWQEVENVMSSHLTTSGMTPASITHYSSPMEAPPVHFGFMPLH